jgi:hypothetical protein
VSTDSVGGNTGGSELVIVDHGSSMDAVQKSLMSVINDVEWDKLAETIK